MLTEETHAGGVADKISEHEEAAHEKRNWVRLTFDCNNRCIFCLDSDTHDGEIRAREEVKQQILDGRKKGAQRLILSGGEPTIHPNYVDFIKLGNSAGYRKVQTVTNGRLFSYPEFLNKCLDAGLSEITFSVHGPNAKIHDALVGVKGAYEQEIEGLRAALADGRPIVNIDIVINRGNVKQLPEMLRKYVAMGVREYDLLQVVPFGRAFTEGRDTLFYDLEEMRPYLLEALEFSKMPDMHIWMNRFPPQHLEGYEHLIQDPYKLNDEVRGRKEEYARLLDQGIALDCRDPGRCKYCYLERLCDTLEDVRATAREAQFDVVRVDTTWEASQGPVFGGDPASARRARAEAHGERAGNGHGQGHGQGQGSGNGHGGEAEVAVGSDGRTRLPIVLAPTPTPVRSIDALVADSGARIVWVKAPDLGAARTEIRRFAGVTDVTLELDEYRGLQEALGVDGTLDGRRIVRAHARTRDQATRLLAMPYTFEVVVDLTRETAEWLESLPDVPSRIALRQPTYERLTEARESDVDLRAFFTRFRSAVPLEGIPACASGRLPREDPRVLDTAMMTPDGRLEVFRYTKRFIVEHYRTKSLRCKSCVYNGGCDGVHINYVRAHGYGVMQPVASDAE